MPAALSAEPPGYSGRAAVGVLRSDRGSLTVNGKASFEQRGTLVRLDILLAGLDAAFEQRAGESRSGGRLHHRLRSVDAALHGVVGRAPRLLHRNRIARAGRVAVADARSHGVARTVAPSRSPFEDLKDLKAFSMSVNMVPTKETVDGHPTTAFDFNLQAQGKGEPVVFTGPRISPTT